MINAILFSFLLLLPQSEFSSSVSAVTTPAVRTSFSASSWTPPGKESLSSAHVMPIQ